MQKPSEGRVRAVIENVQPRIDAGDFPVKRIAGDVVTVTADAFADGHDLLRVELQWRATRAFAPVDIDTPWSRTAMTPLGNDRWKATFSADQIGGYQFRIAAAIDHFATWQHDMASRIDAGQDVSVDLEIGARLVEEGCKRAQAVKAHQDTAALRNAESVLRDKVELGAIQALDERLASIMAAHPDRSLESLSPIYSVLVERPKARYSTWYELFPRSLGGSQRHGTLQDVRNELPRIAELGFDVLYLPPIHPIGVAFRKGPNNAVTAQQGDLGSPWAIGATEGGHTEINPLLGVMDDLHALVEAAPLHGIEIALDIAFQCSPNHPWVSAHPQWFKSRPDGTIQYAENPPKKYQDIYPLDFESADWQALWDALRDVFLFWIEKGVKIFRVDNPHTKAFPFWTWVIAEIKSAHPDVLFLAEAFTRPRVMERLAKIGYSQSYTYFSWRNTAAEMQEYLTELTQPPLSEYFGPNFWPNTPDILPGALQSRNPAAYEARLVLAATLAASYGIYGPAFRLMESTPLKPGGEEYLHSEKYQTREWNYDDASDIDILIQRINATRKDEKALQTNSTLQFYPTNNPNILCYSKRAEDDSSTVLVIVSFDFEHPQTAELGLESLGLNGGASFKVKEVLRGWQTEWSNPRQPYTVDPSVASTAVLLLET